MKEQPPAHAPPVRMKYFACDKSGAHEGQCLNLICLDSGCSNKGLVCSICRAESHQKHRVMPLKMFLEEIGKQKASTETNQLSRILQDLHNNKSEVLASLKETVRKLAESIRKAEQNVLSYYSLVQRQILGKVKLTEELSSIVKTFLRNGYESDSLARSDMLRVVDNLRIHKSKLKEQEIAVDIDFESYLSEATTINVKMKAEVDKLKQIVADFADQSEVLCRSSLMKKCGSLLLFSKEFKANEIELSTDRLMATKTLNNLPRTLLCESPLKNGMNRISLRLKGLKQEIGVGIGLYSKIKERGFTFDGSLLGHGMYMVTNNGTTYSHSETEENGAKKGLTLESNDTVQIEHLSRSDRLTIRKLNSDSKVELRLNIPTTEQGKIYFCVMLSNIGDSIEIVN